MVIGIDASRANLSHKSGPEWYSYYMIRWLAKLDDKNEYILYTNKPLTGGLLDLTTEQYDENDEKSTAPIGVDKSGFQKIKSPYGNFKAKLLQWPFKYFWTQGCLSLEMIFNRPDVLFVPGHVLPMVCPHKSIVTIHDIGLKDKIYDYREGVIGSYRSRRRRFLNMIVGILSFGKYQVNALDYLEWSTFFAVKHAKKIIVASNSTRDDLINNFKCPNQKITVIPNGYNKLLYKKIDDEKKILAVLGKYGIERPYIFFIGRLERKKNIPALIEAFAMLKERRKDMKHTLVMVGDASYGYDEIKYMIDEFDLVDEVVMPGWVNETDIPYIYNGADVFVFPSKCEGFGIPLLQAMACGTPIAASNVTAIPEVVGEAALQFDPRYVLSITEALEQVLENKDLRDKLISSGFERIKDYSWEKTARETLNELLNL
jgi:glycosyltransferase involved in cell wall biosynthesis